METAVVVLSSIVLRFQSHICIQQSPSGSGVWEIGKLSPIPEEIFQRGENKAELQLNNPWRLDLFEREIFSREGLQRRISSSVEGQDKCYFIPVSYLLEIIGE